jgi:hypothetical protein
MLDALLMVIARVFEDVALLASFTWTVNGEVPAELGVPDMIPVELFSDIPAGKVPAVVDHRYGCRPPVAARVWL